MDRFIEWFGTEGASLLILRASSMVERENPKLAEKLDQVADMLQEALELYQRRQA